MNYDESLNNLASMIAYLDNRIDSISNQPNIKSDIKSKLELIRNRIIMDGITKTQEVVASDRL